MLTLIIDKSEAFCRFQLKQSLKKLQTTNTQQEKVLTNTQNITLFGDTPTIIIELESTEQLKQTVTQLEKTTMEELKENCSQGLIIWSTIPRTSTKKLEKKCKELGFETILPASKKEEPLTLKLVKSLKLSKEAETFLLDYIGDDHDNALSLVSTISELPPSTRHKISVEDLYVRLPQSPGSLPPWDVEKHILNNNTIKAISTARRVHKSSNHLVWVSILKKKLHTYYRINALLQDNPRVTDKEIATVLNIKPNGLYYSKKTAQKYSTQQLHYALQLIVNTEGMLKGDKATPVEETAEKLIIQLTRILNG